MVWWKVTQKNMAWGRIHASMNHGQNMLINNFKSMLKLLDGGIFHKVPSFSLFYIRYFINVLDEHLESMFRKSANKIQTLMRLQAEKVGRNFEADI